MKGAMACALGVARASYAGRRRVNQDWSGYYVPSDASQMRRKGAIFAVGDGFGAIGRWASRSAIQILIHEYYRNASPSIEFALTSAVQRANAQIHAQALQQRSHRAAGTTLTAAVVRGNELHVANVGDSRAYLLRGRRAQRISADHSFAAQEVARGGLTPLEARRHPWRHMLTRFLGQKPTVKVDLFRQRLRQGDVLLLCTDGLTERVTGPELSRLDSARWPQQMAPLLVNLAARRGADDDATSLVVKVGAGPEPRWPGESWQPASGADQAAAVLRSALPLVAALAAATVLMVILAYLLAAPVR